MTLLPGVLAFSGMTTGFEPASLPAISWPFPTSSGNAALKMVQAIGLEPMRSMRTARELRFGRDLSSDVVP